MGLLSLRTEGLEETETALKELVHKLTCSETYHNGSSLKNTWTIHKGDSLTKFWASVEGTGIC